MATQKDTIEFILDKLHNPKRFAGRAMFGEYALYADGKVVALVCNDQLYVKILPPSADLEDMCEKAPPYSGAKPHYLVEEEQLTKLPQLASVLIGIAASLPKPKKKRKKDK